MLNMRHWYEKKKTLYPSKFTILSIHKKTFDHLINENHVHIALTATMQPPTSLINLIFIFIFTHILLIVNICLVFR